MGVIDWMRARDQGLTNEKLPNVAHDYSSSSDTDSLEARNEKEVQAHPDQVTKDAQLGVQKAEAAALVWSQTAVRLTYLW